MQQDQTRAQAEAAPRPLPVRDVLPDDVAALFISFLLFFFKIIIKKYTNNKCFRTTRTDCVFDISSFGASSGVFLVRPLSLSLTGPYVLLISAVSAGQERRRAVCLVVFSRQRRRPAHF